MAYPASKTTFSDPAGTSLLTSPDHATLHSSVNDTVEAIQDTAGTTLGTNIFMHMAAGNFPARVTGVAATGTFQQTLVGGTLSTNVISNQLGTLGFLNKGTLGSVQSLGGTFNAFVMGSPNGTGGTLVGMHISTGTVAPGTYLTVNSIPGSALSTNANLLSYTSGTNFSGTFQTSTQVTDLSGTVTIPAGGRRLKLTAYVPNISISNAGIEVLTIWKGAVGSGTALNLQVISAPAGFNGATFNVVATEVPSAGLGTYNVGYHTTAGTLTLLGSATAPIFLLAELV